MAAARHDDDDPFDEFGVLRDGRSVRVSMQMRDAAMADSQRDAARRFDDRLALHRPGPRYSTDQAGIDAKAKAYADSVVELTTAWQRKPVADADTGFGSGEFQGAMEGDVCTVREGGVDEGSPGHLRMVSGKLTCVPDRSQDSAPPRTMTPDAAKAILDAAWRASVEEDENAWRRPAR
jgi:hypothetical protein